MDELIETLRRFGERTGAGFVAFVVKTGLACVGVYVIARVVLPALAGALTAFFMSPGVIVLAWLIWFAHRSRKRH